VDDCVDESLHPGIFRDDADRSEATVRPERLTSGEEGLDRRPCIDQLARQRSLDALIGDEPLSGPGLGDGAAVAEHPHVCVGKLGLRGESEQQHAAHRRGPIGESQTARHQQSSCVRCTYRLRVAVDQLLVEGPVQRRSLVGGLASIERQLPSLKVGELPCLVTDAKGHLVGFRCVDNLVADTDLDDRYLAHCAASCDLEGLDLNQYGRLGVVESELLQIVEQLWGHPVELMVLQSARLRPVDWESALQVFVDRMSDAVIGWWLYGSAALAVRGVDVMPGDLDLAVEDSRAVGEVMRDLLVERSPR